MVPKALNVKKARALLMQDRGGVTMSTTATVQIPHLKTSSSSSAAQACVAVVPSNSTLSSISVTLVANTPNLKSMETS